MPEALIKFERELSAPNEVFAPDNGILRAASREPDPTLAILSTGPNDQYHLDHRVFAKSSARSWQSGTR
jgi:hypothetical protein